MLAYGASALACSSSGGTEESQPALMTPASGTPAAAAANPGAPASAASPAHTAASPAPASAASSTQSEAPAAPAGRAPSAEAESGGPAPARDAGAPSSPPADAGAVAPAPSSFSPCPSDGSACAILPLGDSITFGVGSSTGGGYRIELLRQAVQNGQRVNFVGTQQSGPITLDGAAFPRNNEGHSGFTITQIANLTDNAIRQTSPNIVLLLAGTNDFDGVGQEPTNQAPNRLAALIDRITTDAPNALLAVAQIIPITMGNGAALVPPYNAALPALVQARASQGKHVILVDMFTPFNSAPNFASTIMNDFLHPNDAGYVIMGRTWHDAIDSFLPRNP